MPELTETVARRAAERAVADREAVYLGDVRRIVDDTLGLVERTGNLNPSLRQILTATGLSTQAFYRYFTSKDELLLVLLDDGRRRLEDYLSARMDRVGDPAAKIAAWIEGVLAQAADPKAAARTRPFVANEGRLAEAFPLEQQASVERLTGLLAAPIAALGSAGAPGTGREDQRAAAVYDLTFGALRRALLTRRPPTRAEIDLLVTFALGGIRAGHSGSNVQQRTGR